MIYKTGFKESKLLQNDLIFNLCKTVYSKNKIGKYLVNKYINCFEGGQYYSNTLRRIFREVYDIEVGIGSYGGIFQGGFRPHVKVGNYCSFAPGIQRLYANHPMNDISTHPLFHLKEFGCVEINKNPIYNLEIGNDVWIGVNAILTSKCTYIGNGAVIGAGAVVTHDIEPYAIYAGNPAKLIRYRFDETTRCLLSESKWYELNPDQLKPLISQFISIEDFCEKAAQITSEQK